jgi:hypothetical protein
MLILLTIVAIAGDNCLLDTCSDAESRPTAGMSVLAEPLAPCSTSPMTGWFRDSYCRTDDRDRGVHVICAEMTPEFLRFTREQGNDLSTPHPAAKFPGLRPGDRWCLCASRWLQAHRAGQAPLPILSATHLKALQIVDKPTLEQAAKRTRDGGR